MAVKRTAQQHQPVPVPLANPISPTAPQIIARSDMRIIPLNLFQTWVTSTLPPMMQLVVDQLKEQNPEFTHFLYDDAMCDALIAKNFDADVLFAFRHLKPGAYKADLWRYCVLYVHGGVYLDIKFKCVNNFRLIQLTDQEYLVRDRVLKGVDCGVYNGLMVSMPGNPRLREAIQKIVDHVKYGFYVLDGYHALNALAVTGPILFAQVQEYPALYGSTLGFDGHSVTHHHKPILTVYAEYEKEKVQPALAYYTLLYKNADIYHFTTLRQAASQVVDQCQQIEDQRILYHSSNCCIVAHPTTPKHYLLWKRWINYVMSETGVGSPTTPECGANISLNSVQELDANLRPITRPEFCTPALRKDSATNVGVEDVRVYMYDKHLYLVGSTWDSAAQQIKVAAMCTPRQEWPSLLIKEPSLIQPTFYSQAPTEKNWVFVPYQDKLRVVYQWYPLTLAELNFGDNTLNLVDIKYVGGDCFKGAKGSTCGAVFGDEIWFVVHKSMKNNYVHFFAIFDRDMNFLRHSELFKFDNARVEYCLGLVVEPNRVILSYSVLDTQSYVAEYTHDNLSTILRWF